MPIFTYKCLGCDDVRWDETRVREDPLLAAAKLACPACGWFGGYRTFSPTTTVYYHGTGWSQVDKNYDSHGNHVG